MANIGPPLTRIKERWELTLQPAGGIYLPKGRGNASTLAMLIGGLQKVSLIDFPGKIASVVFTQGCNFRCPFCHNATLVDHGQFGPALPEGEVLQYLATRKKQIDGVVISGGEPTLHADLGQFVERVKDLGLCVKLDTNGTKPDTVADLIGANLLDFIAMDIKHDFAKYDSACGVGAKVGDIIRSVELIKNCSIGYEFRTTIVPGIHSGSDIVSIARSIKGAGKFVIQEFVPDHALDENLRQRVKNSLFSLDRREELKSIESECLKYVSDFDVRFANG